MYSSLFFGPSYAWKMCSLQSKELPFHWVAQGLWIDQERRLEFQASFSVYRSFSSFQPLLNYTFNILVKVFGGLFACIWYKALQ